MAIAESREVGHGTPSARSPRSDQGSPFRFAIDGLLLRRRYSAAVGLLDWRGWDRLDDLDRRMGFCREWNERSLRHQERFLWLIMVIVVLAAVINAVQSRWVWVGVDSALAAWNGRALQRIRSRAAPS